MDRKKLIGLGITITALLVIGFTVRRAVYYAPDTEITPPEIIAGATTSATATAGGTARPGTPNTGAAAGATGTTAASAEKPLRLTIPSIGVNAAVQYVGIKSNGAMANPSNFKDVGWYKLGTVPGATGSAVMAGHVDNALALSGVFKRLGEMQVGDDVYVTRNDGKKLHFRVIDREEYPYKSAPSKKIFADTTGKYLNLITCSGTWIQSEKSYDKRLVVYTELVD